MSSNEQSVLVVIEHDGRQAKPASLRAITAARELSDALSLVCIGHEVEPVATCLTELGAAKVYVADDEALADPVADRYAQVIAETAAIAGAQTILAASSTFSRDILPRVAALVDAPMLSDVVQIETGSDGNVFQRPINAGSELATVTLDAERRVLTVRPGAFEMPQPTVGKSALETVSISPQSPPAGTRFVSREERKSPRPELSEARVVVAGGRPIKDQESYERLVGGLADSLGGAVGATRALVDAGVVPNDWQIGQTGKVLAPELYIGMGISGSVQHLAGIMDARIIVAINKDPQAPLMKVASYAVVGDLFEVVPELIEKLGQNS